MLREASEAYDDGEYLKVHALLVEGLRYGNNAAILAAGAANDMIREIAENK